MHNADLLGFDDAEIALIATTALFHRRTAPGKRHKEFAALDEAAQEIVRVLSMLLRLAESLDRSHASLVQRARLEATGKKTACLEISAAQDCSLEINGLRLQMEAFQKVFGRKLEIKEMERT